MKTFIKNQSATVALLAVGLAVGLLLARSTPEVPVAATATDRLGDYALATGFVGDGVEAVYFLDHITGKLTGGVVSRQARAFQALYVADLNADLAQILAAQQAAGGAPVQFPAKPQYMIATGINDIERRGGAGGTVPGLSTVFVAETNTGIVMAYVVPYNPSAHGAGQLHRDRMTPWATQQFSTAVFRD